MTSVATGSSHTLALTETGQVYAWGAAWSGQLGLGHTKREGNSLPKRLTRCFPTPNLITSLKVHIARISCGSVHSACLSNTGFLYTFGCGDGGRLGHGDHDDRTEPVMVTSLQKDRVVTMCCGNWHTLCIVSSRKSILADVPASGYVS